MDVYVILHLMLFCSQSSFWILKPCELNSVGRTVGIHVHSDTKMVLEV